ncbi:fibronectin type III domain-containing protein [Thiovibrio frasassiensis]|uniref:Fibronectin type III domain-containing protein n=1 Tax=Thiovibrio frasassiensis TaxID=2984131 RepID=A0A9X4RLY9_9BACT|nr:fibronectin type III domain-containing protein [Thiovibrio frasassiensis]MDG4475658.1 fibronectin type III domain-containing protein [Thiovibrio frasassiensis]
MLLLALAAVFAAGLGGCGKKTRPVPPDTVMPAPISDLRYQLDEKGVELSWSYPRATVEGDRLPYRIEKFELLRAVIPAKDYCPDCPIPFGPPIEITAESGDKGKVFYQETLLRPNHRYVYRVRSKAGWFVSSDDSNTVSVVWDTPLLPPVNFRIEEADKTLTLHWQPPAGLLDGTPVSDPIQYQISRSTDDGETFSEMPGKLIETLTYTDRGLRNGKAYLYKVRAIRLHADTVAAGMPSPSLSAVPRDLTPPAPPQTIRVVASASGVKIFWETVAEPDLAGFRIYRRAANSQTPVRIGEVGGAGLSFLDAKPPKGRGLWYYSVTAFDQARPANESTYSMEATYNEE